MKIILTVLLLILSCYTSQTLSQESSVSWNGIGIWNTNSNKSISIGYVGWSGDQGIAKIEIPDAYYAFNIFQQSTFNNVTKVLTFIAQKFESYGGSTIYAIDCVAWEIVYSTHYNSFYHIGGLVSSQTKDDNVYGNYYTGTNPNGIYRMAIVMGTMVVYGHDSAEYRGSVFDTSNNIFYCATNNFTGLYLKGYTTSFTNVYEKKISFANNVNPVANNPLNLVYDSYSNTIVANVNMYQDNTFLYALGYLDLTSGVISVTKMSGYTSELFATTVVGSTYAYTFACDQSASNFYLYQWNLYTGTFSSHKNYNTPVLAAF